MSDRQDTYETPEMCELGSFEDLTLGGGGFVFDEHDTNEALFGSASS